ncbi:MAG: hypothetical protein RML94_14630 [Bacteroidia bacterium]|nr:hypothetical protein [Bacteroidia bacterium]
MRWACVSTVRSEAKHRSESVARSTPTRAQARDTPKKVIAIPNLSKKI